MGINFESLKELVNKNRMVIILGTAGVGKTTTLMKLVKDETFVISELSEADFKLKCKKYNIHGKNIVFTNNVDNIKDTLKQCINDIKIKNIVIDHPYFSVNKDCDRLISLLKHSGKNVILGSQINKISEDDNMTKDEVKEEISKNFDLVVAISNIKNENQYNVLFEANKIEGSN